MILFNIAQKQEKFNEKVQNKNQKFKEVMNITRKKLKFDKKYKDLY